MYLDYYNSPVRLRFALWMQYIVLYSALILFGDDVGYRSKVECVSSEAASLAQRNNLKIVLGSKLRKSNILRVSRKLGYSHKKEVYLTTGVENVEICC